MKKRKRQTPEIENEQQGKNLSEEEEEEETEDEWEDEFYVLLAPDGAPFPDLESKQVSVLALDSSTPFFQIGQQVYQGIYEDVCGTDLIFRSSAKKTGEKIPYTEPETSFKRIRLTPVQLQPKVNLTP